MFFCCASFLLFFPLHRQASPPYDVPKYIVYENCLLELFELCPVCSSMCDVRKTIRGTFLAVDQTCHRCEFNRQWKSQPFIGSTPAGNNHLSAAVYFTGTSFIQMKKVFRCQFVQNYFFVIRISTCNLHFFHYFLKRFSTRLV